MFTVEHELIYLETDPLVFYLQHQKVDLIQIRRYYYTFKIPKWYAFSGGQVVVQKL